MWSPDLTPYSGPLYLRIVAAMAQAINSGELAEGDKLPPQRQLAWQLNINLSTVTKAFQEASKRHLIYGEVGRGTFILGKSSEAALFKLKKENPDQLIDLSTHVPALNPVDHPVDHSASNAAKSPLAKTLTALLSNENDIGDLLNYHTYTQNIRLNTHFQLYAYMSIDMYRACHTTC